MVYPSVRNPGGRCIGAFKPRAVDIPKPVKHIQYHWTAHKVARYFDYATESWHAI